MPNKERVTVEITVRLECSWEPGELFEDPKDAIAMDHVVRNTVHFAFGVPWDAIEGRAFGQPSLEWKVVG